MPQEITVTRNWAGATTEATIPWPTFQDALVYDLAVRLEVGMTHHVAHPPFSYTLTKKHGEHPYPGGISSAMELLTMGAHVGTHVDAPGHISLNGCVFGGRDVMQAQEWYSGVKVGSVEELPPLIGQGHLIDAEVLFGREVTSADGIGVAELERWFADKPSPGAGSIVLVRYGYMKYWNEPDKYLGTVEGLPGMKLEGARWLSARGILATGADTVNYEHKPSVAVTSLSVHVHNLVEMGIPIMESMNLEVLSADKRYEFFFTAAPLRIGGGTGSPLRPLAFVAR
jgi:kynurenine formamidase